MSNAELSFLDPGKCFVLKTTQEKFGSGLTQVNKVNSRCPSDVEISRLDRSISGGIDCRRALVNIER